MTARARRPGRSARGRGELVALGELAALVVPGELDRLQGSRTRRGRRTSGHAGVELVAALTPRARPGPALSRPRGPGRVDARRPQPFELLDELRAAALGVELDARAQGSRTGRTRDEVRRPTARAFVQPGRAARPRSGSWSSRARRRSTEPSVAHRCHRTPARRADAWGRRAVSEFARGGRSAESRPGARPWV